MITTFVLSMIPHITSLGVRRTKLKAKVAYLGMSPLKKTIGSIIIYVLLKLTLIVFLILNFPPSLSRVLQDSQKVIIADIYINPVLVDVIFVGNGATNPLVLDGLLMVLVGLKFLINVIGARGSCRLFTGRLLTGHIRIASCVCPDHLLYIFFGLTMAYLRIRLLTYSGTRQLTIVGTTTIYIQVTP